MHSSPLVTSQWLQTHLQDPDLVVIEASIGKVIGKEPIVYESPVCIPNAIKLDIETDLSDLTSNAVHAFPSLEQMRSLLKRVGVSQRQTLVIYDNQGIYAAPRVWWIFKTFGFDKVYILDGGLPHWLQEGRTVADVYKESTGGAVDEELQLNPTYLKSSDEILSNIQSPSFTVVDARSEDRFMGRVAEPRQGVRSGHIPQSVNLPFPKVLNEYFYKSPQELDQIFGSLSLEPSRAIAFSCGSGITACILLVAALLAGREQVSLYDGSWAEWGAGEVFPVESNSPY